MPDQVVKMVAAIPSPIIFALGVVLLLLGGHWLVEGAVRLARRMRIAPLIVGLTIVAFGTSAPELAFNVIAAISGNASLSFGNVVGSNIANIGLVLGLTALVCPIPLSRQVVRAELPLLMAVTLLATGLALLPLAHSPLPGEESLRYGYGRVEGPILLLFFAGFCALWIRSAQAGRSEIAPVPVVPSDAAPQPSIRSATGLFMAGLAVLLLGGKATEIGAIGIAHAAGLSAGFIGLSIVAVATSLPEIVTSLIAARRGQADLAIGNIIGSNLFNILLVMGVTSVIVPVPVPEGGGADLFMMVALTALLLPMTLRAANRETTQRIPAAIARPEAILLIFCYLAYMTLRLFIDQSDNSPVSTTATALSLGA